MKPIQIIKNIFYKRLFKWLVFSTIGVVFLFPVVSQKVVFPAFYTLMMDNILGEAKKIGTHIARHQDKNRKDTILTGISMNALKSDFNIVKIKLFDRFGYVTFSTDKKDIGSKNKHDYFYKEVSNGEVFYKIVTRGTKSLEEQLVKKDLAEIYIPIVKDGKFIGSSEIYYDITEKREAFHTLTNKVTKAYYSFAAIFIVFMFFIIYKASKLDLLEKENKRKIEELNTSLQEKVEDKTKELQELNENLEKRVEEEIEKNKELSEKIKFTSMSELISNIAHQWRQPLSAISSSLSGIRLQTKLGLVKSIDDIDEDLERAVDTTQQLSHTIDEFRKFFDAKDSLEEFYMKKCINKSLAIFTANIENNEIEIKTDIKDFMIYGSIYNLMQVMLSIFANSKEAFDRSNIKNKKIFINIDKKEQNLFISIKDNAGGIKELEDINKVFEPYYTQKHQSQGTGLGLYVTREIITKGFKGEISLKNREFSIEDMEYKGLEVKIKIPLI